jgi:tetratricopeptide (TPR) repeat protein
MRVVLAFLLAISVGSVAQTSLDSLYKILPSHPDDTAKVVVLNRIAFLNLAHSLDTMQVYALRAIALGERLNYLRGVAEGHKNLGAAYYSQGDYRGGLEELFKALKISEQIGDKRNMAKAYHNIGGTYFYQNDFKRALEYTKNAIELFREAGDTEGWATSQLSVCECYQRLNDPDQALSYCLEALDVFEKRNNKERQAHAMHYLGGIYKIKNQPELALRSYWKAARLVNDGKFYSVGVYLNKDLGEYYLQTKRYDSASYYLYKSLSQIKVYDSKDALMLTYQALSNYHEAKKRYDSALYYNKIYVEATRKDFDLRRNDQLASMETHYNLELKSRELQLNQEILRSHRSILIFVIVILVVAILSSSLIFILYWRYRAANKKLTELNAAINEKNEEIMAQSDELLTVNEAVKRVNSDLESMVENRTHEVKVQNQKLLEYAYFNAHKVRGPLARILGLVNVMDLNGNDDDLKFLAAKIRESAEEMDEVVREINKKLDTD